MKKILILILTITLVIPCSANQYSRDTGLVKITAPKGKSYQWYVNKGKKWAKIPDENSRSIKLTVRKRMNGWRYKCLVTAKSGKSKWSAVDKLIITDINKKYSYAINPIPGMFHPKCADGYCYVYSVGMYDEMREAVRQLNKAIGLTFIPTLSPHIADIIIFPWSHRTLQDSVFLRGGEIQSIYHNGCNWVGVTYSENTIHYLICIKTSYQSDMEQCAGIIMHELGHCLGIQHTTDKNSIMWEYVGNSKLSIDDIRLFKKQRKILKQYSKQ